MFNLRFNHVGCVGALVLTIATARRSESSPFDNIYIEQQITEAKIDAIRTSKNPGGAIVGVRIHAESDLDKAIELLPRLVDLHSVQIVDVTLEPKHMAIFPKLYQINRLSLKVSAPKEWTKAVTKCPKLTDLTIAFQTLTEQQILDLQDCKLLRSLSLLHTRLDKTQAKALLQIRQLESLDLFESGEIPIPDLHLLPNLRRLLTDAPILARHADAISKIESLEILGCGIEPGDTVCLEAIGKLTKLSTLHLSSSSFNDKGLAYLRNNRNLTHLSLAGDRLSQRECEILASLPAINMLDLGFSKEEISPLALRSILMNKSLKCLDLRTSKIDKKSIKAIQDAYPKIFIYY